MPALAPNSGGTGTQSSGSTYVSTTIGYGGKPYTGNSTYLNGKLTNKTVGWNGTPYTGNSAWINGKIANAPTFKPSIAVNSPNSTTNNPGPNYTGAGSLAPGNGAGITSSTQLLSLSDVVNRRKGKFNPPPHASSRTVSPTAYAQYSVTSTAGAANIQALLKTNQRGFVYQDLDVALSSSGPKTPWGFQFMYNPTTFSHNNAADTSIDWTNTLDVSSLLTGSQGITFTLFLNRVIDMSALETNDYASKYATALSAEDVKGIKSRGTEYDLEYLYRTINGNPESSPTMDMPTSDFGYLAGVPIWLRLHDNMRYKVALANINVNHIMFSDKLVPVLSEVNLTFMRIPVPIYGNDAALSAWYSNQTLTTPPLTDTANSGG